MLQAILVKTIIGKVMEAIEKADDKRIARSLHPRADWICMDCGCKAKKVEKPSKRRKKRK